MTICVSARRRSLRFIILAVLGAVLMGAGCGHKGPPQPPIVRKPEKNKDLKAVQKGAIAFLVFSPVSTNTDGSLLADMALVSIHRLDIQKPPEKARE
jgi:hypothetical protein